MNELLSQLGCHYIWDFTPEWTRGFEGSRRIAPFDFMIEEKYIIEMDGELGHGKKVHPHSRRTPAETKLKDDWKDAQALLHGFTVIRIPSDKSELDYLRYNIVNSFKSYFRFF